MDLRRVIRSAIFLPLLSILLSIGPADAFAAKSGSTSAEYYDRAIKYLGKDDYRAAIIELKNALQADPNDLSSRILLGKTYLKIEDGASAAKELNRARQMGARDHFVLVPLGRAYVLQGLYGNALKILRTAGQDESTVAEIEIVRGDAHLALRDFAAAADAYGEALNKQPNLVKGFIGLARIDIARGQLDQATRRIEKAVEINPDDAEVWYIRGEIHRHRHVLQAALKDYDQAVKLLPKYIPALTARAGMRIDLGHSEEAEADIAKLRELQPQNPQALYFSALIQAQRGDIKASQQSLIEAENILNTYPAKYIESNPPILLLAGVVSYFRRNFKAAYRHLSLYLEKVPQHLGARRLLASLALKRGEPGKAVDLLATIVSQTPDDVELLTMYGDALMRVGRRQEATEIFKKASSLAKPGSRAQSRLTLLQLIGGQDQDAIAALESEMKRDPASIRAGLVLIGAQVRRGDYEAAMSTVKAVIKHHPDSPVAHNLAGGVRLGLRDVEGARRSFNRALEVAPNYQPALFNLAKLEARLGNLDEARRHYVAILEKDEANGKAMFALADIDRRRKDFDGAFRWLEKARASSRNSAAATLRLIDLFLFTKRADEAVLAATQLHKANPANLTFLSTLGRTLLEAKKIEKAGDVFRQLAERAEERKSPYWLHEASIWLQKVRDFKAARTALENALSFNKAFLPAHLGLFKLDLDAGNLDGARARADRIVALDPEAPAGDIVKGDIHMKLRQFAEAGKAYRAAFDKRPSTPLARRVYYAIRAAGADGLQFISDWADDHSNDAAAQRLLATAYIDAGRTREALTIYERLVVLAPEDVSLLNNMAILYARVDDPQAQQFAKRAYNAAPDSPATMDTYGWILVLRGEAAKGLRLLRNAQFRVPDIPEIRYHMAVALNVLGKKEEALKELRAALRSARPFADRNEAHGLLERLSPSEQPVRP